MAHAENTITIARTPDAVFAFLADGTNNPRWRTGVKSIELRSGTPGEVDAVYAQTLTGPGGRPSPATTASPPRSPGNGSASR